MFKPGLFLLSLVLGTVAAGHTCVHDNLPRELHPTERSHLTYPSDIAEARANTPNSGADRRLKTRANSPIRITYDFSYLETDVNDAAVKAYLKDKILAPAKTMLNEALKVTPVVGNLWYGEKTCTAGRWTSGVNKGKCSGEGATPTCGLGRTIPSKHIKESQVCPDGSDSSTCTTSAGGSGEPNTDFLFYVYASETASCGGGTLAFAAACAQDTLDRPIVGYVNFCAVSLKIATDPVEIFDVVMTTVHEMTHALVLSAGLFGYYRDSAGNPRSTRPTDGSDPTPGSSTLGTFTERGHQVQKIVTPKVLEAARAHFGCSTLNGAEIEEGGGAGTAGSHWEQRIFHGEYMVGVATSIPPKFSNITLALFEDSGWYMPDYSRAAFLPYGNQQGCDFATAKCLTPASPPTVPSYGVGYWCTADADGCAPDRSAAGKCDTSLYGSDLPGSYQYFTDNSKKGGSMSVVDYCPFVSGYSNRICAKAAAQSSRSNSQGWKYGSTSRCFTTTLSNNGGTAEDHECYPISCDGTTLKVEIGGTLTTCGDGNLVTAPGFTGALTCPSAAETAKILCPASGHGPSTSTSGSTSGGSTSGGSTSGGSTSGGSTSGGTGSTGTTGGGTVTGTSGSTTGSTTGYGNSLSAASRTSSGVLPLLALALAVLVAPAVLPAL